MIPFWWRVLDRQANGDKKPQARLGIQPILVAVFGDRHTAHGGKSGVAGGNPGGKSGVAGGNPGGKSGVGGEIRCRFIILARKDEQTPDYAKRRTDTGLRAKKTN